MPLRPSFQSWCSFGHLAPATSRFSRSPQAITFVLSTHSACHAHRSSLSSGRSLVLRDTGAVPNLCLFLSRKLDVNVFVALPKLFLLPLRDANIHILGSKRPAVVCQGSQATSKPPHIPFPVRFFTFFAYPPTRLLASNVCTHP